MFSWRNKKDSIFRMKKAPYLLLCQTSCRQFLHGVAQIHLQQAYTGESLEICLARILALRFARFFSLALKPELPICWRTRSSIALCNTE